jgi:glycolate oxidase
MNQGQALTELKEIFEHDEYLDSGTKLERYRLDQVGEKIYGQIPLAVVFPKYTSQVSQLMKWAYKYDIPVTPRGGGSGLSGGAIPAKGGVVCCFDYMNRIIEIDPINQMVVVEPGVVTNALDEALKPYGLFFAGYPMSEDLCQIGGNLAENAGGGRAIKYNTTAHYVVGAEVVTPQGAILNLGGKRLKDVTGYNLLQLFIGSEGTLGIFTQIILKLIPRPNSRGVAFWAFTNATEAVSIFGDLKQVQALSSLEFIDGQTARATNNGLVSTQRTNLPEDKDAYLLLEADGISEDEVSHALSMIGSLCDSAGGQLIASGLDLESYEKAWKLRKAVPWWVKRNALEYHSLEDVVVPPSTIPQLVVFVEQLRNEFLVPIAVFGHAGDGNFHITPMKSPDMGPSEWNSMIPILLTKLYKFVIEQGGTISGEHGIGRKRTQYISLALSDDVIDLMKIVKIGFDPKNLLNPGVIFEKLL